MASRLRQRLADIFTSKEKYTYHALPTTADHVRLLVLEPGSREDELRCSLRPASLTDPSVPRYETTSYVWGAVNMSGELLVGSLLLNIPMSAQRVLQRARLPDGERVLWIDAVCINQSDQQERAQQVALMSRIYSKCFRNLIFLDTDLHDAPSPLESIGMIVADLARVHGQCASMNHLLFDQHNNFKHASTGTHLDLNRAALLELFASTWFSRLWIVQEVALAPESTCMYSKYEIPFLDILRVIAWFSLNYRSETWFRSSPLINFPRLEFLFRWAGVGHLYSRDAITKIKTIHILESMRFFNATDPRDYVFGTLGVQEKLSGSVPSALAPDYSVTYVEVYTRAALAVIERDQALATLGLAGYRSGQPTDNLPSWVPRFNKPIDKFHDANPLRPLGTFAHGGRGLKLHQPPTHSGVLAVSGVILPGPIIKTVPFLREQSSVSDFLTFMSTSFTIAQSQCEIDPLSPDTTLALTLHAGVNLDNSVAGPEQSLLGLHHFLSYLQLNGRFPWSADADPLAVEYYRSMINACYHRAFFATEEGYIGLGPKNVSEGDVVGVLFGGTFPVVLRPLEGRDQKQGMYEFLGVAYVHGLMAGEAVERAERGGSGEVVVRMV